MTSQESHPYGHPSPDEHRRFLISFLFNGSMAPALKECVKRAYLDFSRTADGIGKGVDASLRTDTAHALVLEILTAATLTPWTQDVYDLWHKEQCAVIIRHYADRAYTAFTPGQAQKWLNMAVKYALCLHGAEMLPLSRAASLWRVAHAPLDNYILDALCTEHGAQPLDCTWSRIATYEDYFEVQRWIRTKFAPRPALDVEFRVWLKAAAQLRGHVQ
jgi:hypothetical protein